MHLLLLNCYTRSLGTQVRGFLLVAASYLLCAAVQSTEVPRLLPDIQMPLLHRTWKNWDQGLHFRSCQRNTNKQFQDLKEHPWYTRVFTSALSLVAISLLSDFAPIAHLQKCAHNTYTQRQNTLRSNETWNTLKFYFKSYKQWHVFRQA